MPIPLPRMLSTPLRLSAMTLRGLGPYLHGARLEFKPLTILCGENGSGKSTWIETLRAIKTTASDKRFPLTQPVYSKDVERYGVNQNLASTGDNGLRPAGEIQADVARMVRSGDVELFGPLGCIGLELEATKSITLRGYPELDQEFPNDAQSLLFQANVPAGAKLLLRWAMPLQIDGFDDLVELRVNAECMRLRRSRGRTAESVFRRGHSKEELHTFECTGGFLGLPATVAGRFFELGYVKIQASSDNKDSQKWTLIEIEPSTSEAFPEINFASVVSVCERFLRVFRHVVRVALRGFFSIGPIRTLLTEIHADSTPTNSKHDPEMTTPEEGPSEFHTRSNRVYEDAKAKVRPHLRYVGHNGGLTQFLHAYWSYNLMRQPTPPYVGAIANEFQLSDFTRDYKTPPHAAETFVDNLSEPFQEHILAIVNPSIREAWICGRDTADRDQISIQVLNDALKSRNLFAPREFRPDISRSDAYHEVQLMLGTTPEEQDERLASRQLLTDAEVVRINRLLLEAVIDKAADEWVEEELKLGLQVKDYEYSGRKCWHRTGFLLETFVSYWMNRLTGTSIKYQKFEGDFLETKWINPPGIDVVPNGGLVDQTRHWHKRGDWADRTDGRDHSYNGRSCDLVGTIQHPVMSQNSDWSLMSTGFHQLAPIVVQSALLHQNEMMAIENPEAHLHPSLQLKVAEFLMHQANAGKIMLVETHSDMLVRRVLRAIREEQVSPGNVFKQSSVGIAFTSLSNDSNGFMSAKMEKLEINDHGQVQNWPIGFMDDDLREADRWLQANFRGGILDDDSDE